MSRLAIVVALLLLLKVEAIGAVENYQRPSLGPTRIITTGLMAPTPEGGLVPLTGMSPDLGCRHMKFLRTTCFEVEALLNSRLARDLATLPKSN